ncbi:MAG: formate dehydrogenase iron-sulfur subunit [Chthoniobacter sp.]|jgi:Fe-S-cluster-containing dehydrogenase component/DMSO reductase anchor subunit|nr:formate dehydrogenase iron-sulfur subunit [Chthoniobacter sp.]
MTALLEPEERTLIDELLAEQQRLTAVERFAQKHERHALPAQARYYQDLIPLSKPQPGEQYAFGVDLDACTGCKACVSACHSLNGLDEDEIWRNVGLIHGGTAAAPYQQTVTTACHHCVEPACLEGCPVRAYEKDAETGIVRHLDDQCIGCQYCVLKCPYDVPKYSPKKGIVRKCDMCYSRLTADEAPACVQACPNGAITIRIVTKAELTARLAPGDQLLPGAFDSNYTKPTTAYATRRPPPANASAGNARTLRLEHAHWPLIWMLVLTQLAVGLFLVAAFASEQLPLAATAFAALNLGLAVSVLHLGRPLGAWRAFLGLRTSWMSREIFAFSAFAGCGGAFTFTTMWPRLAEAIPALHRVEAFVQPAQFTPLLAVLTTLLGLLGVFCSVMIYVDTRRAFWESSFTNTRFFGTTLLLGAAGSAAVLGWWQVITGAPAGAAAGLCAAMATVFGAALGGWEATNLRAALRSSDDPNHRSALTIWKLCRPLLLARFVLLAGAVLCGLAALASTGWPAAAWATGSFALSFPGQIIERFFFFTAVVAPRMPGGVTA